MREAAQLSLEPDKEKIEAALNEFEALIKHTGLTPTQQNNGLINYAQALQRNGKHQDALTVLDQIHTQEDQNAKRQIQFYVDLIKASSLSVLGEHGRAVELVRNCTQHLEDYDERERGLFLVEVGKILSNAEEVEEAATYWKKGLKALKNYPAETEHYARLLSNLASLKLKSGNEESEAEGVELMDQAIEMKVSNGDLHGLANSYDILAQYYTRIKRFERAIVYFRRGLLISRQVGDTHGLIQALMNVAGLYIQLRQVPNARRLMKEALTLSEETENQYFMKMCQYNLEQINLNAREFNLNGDIIGPKAACLCGSNKPYEECCGRADFEPVTLPWAFGDLSQNAEQVYEELKAQGIKPSRLDLFLQNPTHDQNRYAWFKVIPQDGWHEVQELPDLASIHLRSAQDAMERSQQIPESFEHPLTTLILAACALEAFINQVSFFITEVHSTETLDISEVPPALISDCFAYQRSTGLIEKWADLSKALCGLGWPSDSALWDDFKRLVTMRNEFVHFKLADYEQIVPPPKKSSKSLAMLPPSVAPRDNHHGWAFKLLSPEMATWAVSVAQDMFSGFRSGYATMRTSEKAP